MGTGSANLVVDDTGRAILFNQGYAGTKLADITNLQYSTYGPSSVLAISLQFDVDYDVTDSNVVYGGRLVYEPYLNGTVTPNTWQTWQPLSGKWWATRTPGSTACPQSDPCTWSQVISAFPNVGIYASGGAVYLKAGGPWDGGFNGNVDAFTIGVGGTDTLYDFELVLLPSDKDLCKDGGWMTFANPTFKNQGDCVNSFLSINR